MFDIELSHKMVTSVVDSDCAIWDGMSSLIEFCSEHESWDGWNALRELDFETDSLTLTNWMTQLLITEPPPKNIKAYWFGLFNPVQNGTTTCGLYAAGAVTFDPDDESFEWACGPAYFPEGRYATSMVLDGIYRKVSTANGFVPSYGEYVLCLGYAGLIVKYLAATIKCELWLDSCATRALAVGFDSGDGMLVGSVTRRGWNPRAA
jgi:hypothetical protein